MSKIAHYLQEHLVGEVMTSVDARRYFSTDASIFSIPPALVVYPRNENDIRKTARFSWQLAERGRVIPITARGAGTDTTGGALGTGLLVVFPAHMNRILELDTKSGSVSVEPGINFGKLQQTLQTHGRFIPAYPASIEYTTVGGAVANNAGGEKSIKYGTMGAYVQGLRVVLANGEVIETERLSKRELSKKLGLATFEGELYRAVDTLLEENRDLLSSTQLSVTKNNAGYNLADIKHKDGSFDLTPLFVGSQGTLGIISEISLTTEAYNPETTLIMASFNNLDGLQSAIDELRLLKELPSALELVNKGLLDAVHQQNPNYLKDLTPVPFPEYILFIEYDLDNDRHNNKMVKKATKILNNLASDVQVEAEPDKQQKFWKVRQASASYTAQTEGQRHPMPIIEDAAVPPDRLNELIDGISQLFRATDVKPIAIWGHAGDGNVHLQPQLNLTQVGDRQKAFRLMDEYYKLVVKLGGSISAEHNDGRLRAPYLEMQYGSEVYALLQKVKQVCDPYNTLNPGVKFGTSIDDIKQLLRSDFSFGHLYDHLPRS